MKPIISNYALLLLIVCASLFPSCKKEEPIKQIDEWTDDATNFNNGSYWVYEHKSFDWSGVEQMYGTFIERDCVVVTTTERNVVVTNGEDYINKIIHCDLYAWDPTSTSYVKFQSDWQLLQISPYQIKFKCPYYLYSNVIDFLLSTDDSRHYDQLTDAVNTFDDVMEYGLEMEMYQLKGLRIAKGVGVTFATESSQGTLFLKNYMIN